ncbi:MAG: hypothetical protein IT428_21970 [Planctomycetaceae bacterium]|nr:hypothetical protein [Planctomycetaceae bacterium]
MRTMTVPLVVLCVAIVARPSPAEDLAAGSRARLVVVAGRLANGLFAGGELKEPFGVDADGAGNLYIAELGGGRIHKLTPKGEFTTIAGTGRKGDEGDRGPAAQATFNGMHNLAVTREGAILVADTWNNRIRRIDPRTGLIGPFAATGKKGDSGDGGPALKAECGGLYCVSLNPAGTRAYVTDLDNRRIRGIDLETGTIAAVAGNGKKGVPVDGSLAIESPLIDPRAAVADSKENVYVLERGGHALRVVTPDGKIRTVAGTGKKGPPQDDVPALEATLNGPKHLCVDRNDDVIIADAENNVIVRYVPRSGRLIRIAGTGKPGKGNLEGTPREAELSRPHGVFVDPKGTLYIVDSYHERVLKWVE